MSTILDALRKVQSERQPRDLRETVLGGGVEGSEPRSRRVVWIALPVLLLLALPASAWFVWPGGDQLMASLPQLPFAGDGDASPDGEAVKPVQTAKAERGPALPQPEAPRVERQAAPVTVQQKVSAGAAREVDGAASPVAERPPAAELPFVGPQQENPAPVLQAKAVAAAPPPAPRAPPAPPTPPAPIAEAPAPERPRPELDLSLKLESLRSAELESANTSDPFGAGGVHEIAFPDLSVEAVRWHPEPERRVARILLDGTRPVEAREGDIVAGVAIQRIDPGAVEVRLGDLRARLKPGQ